ncbi:transposase [Methanosarcina sp. DH2]|uniref:transposase n=1 Tax=Methanosarcina sp. DH2 TaxID=2605639 RepID=UPI002107D867|nr:transposase [Methanosarcina sp. DH2]MCC4770639.1 transposase [Methanosarcina sp. DH2]
MANPKNTSKMCSNCSMLVDKDLLERVHNFCGSPINRDLNASKNILRLELQSVCKTDRCLSLK